MENEIKTAKIEDLIPDDKNFNKGTEKGQKLIENSFSQFGAGRSILIDKNNKIIAGNKSVENATIIGLEDVIIVETTGDKLVAVKRTDIDLDSKEGREMALADNATSKANIEWDEEVLKEVAEEFDIDVEDWNIEIPNYENQSVEEDEVEINEELETDIVIGDMFKIGEHYLLCGDSTQVDSYIKLMQGEYADMVVTDPPYNVAYEGGTKEKMKIQNDDMSNDAFYKFLYDFYTALTTACKKGCAIYVWRSSSEIINFGKAMVDAGWLLKQQLIWVKNTMVMGRQDYQWKHEPCLYGWLAGDSHKWYSDRKQTTVINFDRPQRNGEHPTMKPVGLFSYQINNSSKKGDTVIDPFGGSGTTMVACQNLGRKARIIEYDPKYCQVTIDRMKKLYPEINIEKI